MRYESTATMRMTAMAAIAIAMRTLIIICILASLFVDLFRLTMFAPKITVFKVLKSFIIYSIIFYYTIGMHSYVSALTRRGFSCLRSLLISSMLPFLIAAILRHSSQYSVMCGEVISWSLE